MLIIGQVIKIFLNFLYYLIIAGALLSWFPIDRNNFLIQLINTLTEPRLSPFRALVEKSAIGGKGIPIDISPILALIFIQILISIF